MHRTLASAALNRPAVRITFVATILLLLLAGSRVGGEFAPAPHARRTLPRTSNTGQPQAGRDALLQVWPGDQSQARSTSATHSGPGSFLSQTSTQQARSRSPDLSLSAPRRRNHCAQSGLEHRYYLHSNAK